MGQLLAGFLASAESASGLCSRLNENVQILACFLASAKSASGLCSRLNENVQILACFLASAKSASGLCSRLIENVQLLAGFLASAKSASGLCSRLNENVPLCYSFQRLLLRLSPCRGLPPQRVGSLDERRHGGRLLGLFVLRGRQRQRGLPELQIGQRQPAEQHEPCQRLVRALRPASTRAVFRFWRSDKKQLPLPGVAAAMASVSAVSRSSNPLTT